MTTHKAIAALIMSIIFFVNRYTALDLPITEETIENLIAILTPILVYSIPNKRK